MHRLPEILEKVQAHHPDARLDLLQKAYVFSAKVHRGRTRLSGEPYLIHPLAVAEILADLHMDEVTVACGLLHDTLEDTLTSLEDLREHFGSDVADIVDSLAKLAKVSYSSRKEEQAENFRRLVLTLARDVRVVLVKLADRLHNMRTLSFLPRERQLQAAQETLDIYAPLANRLGIHRVKSELQDLGLQFTEPEAYRELAQKVEKRLAEREQYIEEVTCVLRRILVEQGIEGTVSGRPKHFYSIYRKMIDQGIGFEKVYDLTAFRMILTSVRDCYAVLGAIHGHWTPIPGRFKDYVALPKPNLYQSLHTTVIGPQGQPMEVQIRTEEMHRIAEEGIAAHWRYKEKRAAAPEERIFQWLRQLVDANKEFGDAQEFLESVKVDLFPDVVYVFTPAGELIELPRGSTPVDFAFAVHSKVGEQCVGAKVNERMVPLEHRLKNGDSVEIITSKHHTPSSDWLEFVQTAKAKTKIRQWVKTKQKERSVELGRELCDREFRKAGKSFGKVLREGGLDAVVLKFGFQRPEDLLEAVGYGKVPPRHVLFKCYPELEEEREAEEPRRARKEPKAPKGIVIRDVGDAMVRFARCCNPLPGEPVVGFVTRGHGMAVHTEGCPNVRRLDPERRIAVEWGKGEDASHPVKIRVACEDRKGMLAAITQTFAHFDVSVVRADVKTYVVGEAECNFEILVENLDRLQKILVAIQGLRGVSRVTRLKT